MTLHCKYIGKLKIIDRCNICSGLTAVVLHLTFLNTESSLSLLKKRNETGKLTVKVMTLPKFVIYLTVLSALGGFLFGYDTGRNSTRWQCLIMIYTPLRDRSCFWSNASH